jgi:hypothetical protein
MHGIENMSQYKIDTPCNPEECNCQIMGRFEADVQAINANAKQLLNDVVKIYKHIETYNSLTPKERVSVLSSAVLTSQVLNVRLHHIAHIQKDIDTFIDMVTMENKDARKYLEAVISKTQGLECTICKEEMKKASDA